MVVGEYVVEEIVLYVLAGQWLCIISLDRQGFTTEITDPGAEATKWLDRSSDARKNKY